MQETSPLARSIQLYVVSSPRLFTGLRFSLLHISIGRDGLRDCPLTRGRFLSTNSNPQLLPVKARGRMLSYLASFSGFDLCNGEELAGRIAGESK